ncbi:MAG: hypothetical protein JRH20_00380 [Deltaproteobacteria bacterium]|nr:hypothetical protein [Deltaproteobacteria bacterium]
MDLFCHWAFALLLGASVFLSACWTTPAPPPPNEQAPAEQVIGGRAVESPSRRASQNRPQPWGAEGVHHQTDRLGINAQRVQRSQGKEGKKKQASRMADPGMADPGMANPGMANPKISATTPTISLPEASAPTSSPVGSSEKP